MHARSPAPRALMLLALVMSLSGCAAPSRTVIEPPRLPEPSAESMQAPSSDSYSGRVQQLLRAWREKLTKTEGV